MGGPLHRQSAPTSYLGSGLSHIAYSGEIAMPKHSGKNNTSTSASNKRHPNTPPIALHSILLALEPRMVFDASIAATTEAVDAAAGESAQPAMLAEMQAEAAQTYDAAPPADGSADTTHTTHTAEADETGYTDTTATTDMSRTGQARVLAGIAPLLENTSEWSEESEVTFGSDADFTVNENGTLNLGGKITVTDDDSNIVRVTISVENGTLDLTYVPGLEDNKYFWDGDNKVTFEGDLKTIEAALATLKYKGNDHYNGTDTLTIIVNDGYKATEFSKDITVISVPDAPEFSVPSGNTATKPIDEDAQKEDSYLEFNYGTPDNPSWGKLAITDPDSGDADYADTYDLTLTVKNGSLSASFDGKMLGEGILNTITGERTYSLSGLTRDQVNGLLADLAFKGNQDYNGKTTLSVDVYDTKATAHLARDFEIDVLPVNDDPTVNPAEKGDTGNQLTVKETDSSDPNGIAEGIFDLGHFNKDWDSSVLPGNGGNDPYPLFDIDNNMHQLVVKVTEAPTQGTLWRKIGNDWVKLGVGSTFSLWDVYQGNVKYTHDPANQVREDVYKGSGQDSFKFELNDGAGGSQTGKIFIALDPVNQAPEVVIKPGGVVDSGRVDHQSIRDDKTNEWKDSYTIWGYEGEQGIVFSFDVEDVDQHPDADYKVSFSALPDSSLGKFWYNNGTKWVEVTAGMELSLKAIQSGNLVFNHSGKENGGAVTFKIVVTDDGGGEGPGKELTIEESLSINIRANNDHPEWDSSVIDKWTDAQETVTIEPSGGRTIVIDNSILKVTDNDNPDSDKGRGLTYTITEIDQTTGANGRLLYEISDDGYGNKVYHQYKVGDKITQADIDSGKVVWHFYGSGEDGNASVNIKFTVRDGAMTAVPVPSDGEQAAAPGGSLAPIDELYDSPSNWEDGKGAHEGGIGTWKPIGGDPENGYEWVLTEHTLTIKATDLQPGAPGEIPETIDPVPNFGGTTQGTVNEGNRIEFTHPGDAQAADKVVLDSWFTEKGGDGTRLTTGDTPSADPNNITYRIEQDTVYGQLLYEYESGKFRTLGLYDNFTQADINAGKISYLHNGGEHFSDSFKFSVSDGRNQVKNSGDNNSELFTQSFKIIPINDSPTAAEGKDVEVFEHNDDDLTDGSADKTTPGGTMVITDKNINIYDRDNSENATSDPDFSGNNNLYIIITEGPEHGKLQYKDSNGTWVDIDTFPTAQDLADIMAGKGQAEWGLNGNLVKDKGYIVISKADIIAGKFRYQHDGTENFYDDFKYIVSDDKGVIPTDADHASESLEGNTLNPVEKNQSSVSQYEQGVNIVVKPVNDMPEWVDSKTKTPIKVDEGGTVVINGSGNTIDNIRYADPDGTPSAIQFVVDEIPEHGQLMLNGQVLGKGATFTQDDLDKGRVTYKHDDTENHSDGFKCKVTDSIHTSDPVEFKIEVEQVNDPIDIELKKGKDEVYVESIAGDGLIIDDLKIIDADYAGWTRDDGTYDGTGVIDHQITVDITVKLGNYGIEESDITNGYVVFTLKDNSTLTLTLTSPGSKTFTARLEGTYEQVQGLLDEITIKTTLKNSVQFDPDGSITMEFKVTDAKSDGSGGWETPNGGKGQVYSDTTTLTVFISPVNDPPEIANAESDMNITLSEDAGYVTIVDKLGESIEITDVDAFERGGNSITLSVEHGTLIVGSVAGLGVKGMGTNEITLTGTLKQINDALKNLQYKSESNWNGTETLKIVYKDNANNGERPATITDSQTQDQATGYNDNFWYTRTDANGNPLLKPDGVTPANLGLGVVGSFEITVTPVNDTPSVEVPDNLYLDDSFKFSGDPDGTDANAKDILGKTGVITIDDIDLPPAEDGYPGNASGTGDPYWENEFTVTLKVTKDDGSASVHGSLTITDNGTLVSGNGTDEIVLKGTREDINDALKTLVYDRSNWDEATDHLKVTVSDISGGASNGSTDPGSKRTADKTIILHCSENNDVPVITMPSVDWTVNEDLNGESTYSNGGSDWVLPFQDIDLNDNDSFDGQVFVSISVDHGQLDISEVTALNTTSGNPALRDGIVLDGNTIYFKGPLDKIEAALKQVGFKPDANWNGDVNVTVYVNDMGFTGKTGSGSTPETPAGCPESGVFGTIKDKTGLASEATHTLTVNPVNDAPVASGGVNFWGSTPTTSGDWEDTLVGSTTGKSVSDLFGSKFNDATDAQYNSSTNPSGSSANSMLGVVVEVNGATAAQGAWMYSLDNGATWTAMPTVSASSGFFLANSALLTFVPAADFNGEPGALTVRMADNSGESSTHPASGDTVNVNGTNSGGTTRYSSGGVTLKTYVRAVNDAPEINSGKENVTLPAVNEDNKNGAGQKVSDLFGDSFKDTKDTVTSAEGTTGSSANGLAGVVITGNAASKTNQGVWEYYNGSTWVEISTSVSDSNGLFLNGDTEIRFVPNDNWNGTPGSLTAHLVDNSTQNTDKGPADTVPASTGATVNLTSTGTGGTTRYSTDTVTLGTSVTAVNDAPVVDGGSGEPVVVDLPSILEDTPGNGSTVSDLFGTYFNDGMDTVSGGSSANSPAGVLVAGNSADPADSDNTKGVWQYKPNGSSTWVDIPKVESGEGFALKATDSIRFKPAAEFNGTPPSLVVRLIDNSTTVSGSNPAAVWNTKTTISSVGGVTRYSSDTITLDTAVTAVNDAPTIVTGKETVAPPRTEDTNFSDTVENIFGPSFSDAKDAVTNGSSADSFQGIIITGNATASAQGKWYYKDASNQWQEISTTLSASSGLYLAKGTEIKFEPALDYNGTPGTLTVRLVETGSQTFSTDTPVDVSSTNSGGATQISSASVTLGGTVGAVNDAPVADNNTVINYPAINEDADVPGDSVSNIFGSRFSDAKDNVTSGSSSNSFVGIIVSSVTNNTNGAWQYSPDNGTTWTNITNGMFIRATDSIRFQPVDNWNGTPSDLSAYLVENSGDYSGTLPASGTAKSADSRGGATAISQDAVTVRAVVAPVNDAPTWSDTGLPTVPGTSSDKGLDMGVIVPVNPPSAPGDNISSEMSVGDLISNNNAFNDAKDNVSGGSSADDLAGIFITGSTVPTGSPSLGHWEYSTNGGSSWSSLPSASASNALFLDADAKIRFVHDPDYVGTNYLASLQVALADDSGANGTLNAGTQYDISGTNRGGVKAVSSDDRTVFVQVYPSNLYPSFPTSPGNNYGLTERAPGQLSNDVSVADPNLDADTWNGGSVTIHRDGGANAEDSFGASGLLVFNADGTFSYNGTVCGNVAQNGGGVLQLAFNDQVTNANVDAILRSITYTNGSHNPDPAADIPIRWTVDDGNYQPSNGLPPQGLNLNGDTSGKASAVQNVRVTTLTNDAPVAVDDDASVKTDDTTPTTGNILDNDWDYDTPHGNLTVTDSDADKALYGTLVINPDGTYTYTIDPANPAVSGLKPGEKLTERIEYTITDGQYTATAYLVITIEGPLDMPPNEIDVPGHNKLPAPSFPERETPTLPGTGRHDLETPKPVVDEVGTTRESLDTSLRGSLNNLTDDSRLANGFLPGLRLTGSHVSKSFMSISPYGLGIIDLATPKPVVQEVSGMRETLMRSTTRFLANIDSDLEYLSPLTASPAAWNEPEATAAGPEGASPLPIVPQSDENVPAADEATAEPAESEDVVSALPGAESLHDQIARNGQLSLVEKARECIVALI